MNALRVVYFAVLCLLAGCASHSEPPADPEYRFWVEDPAGGVASEPSPLRGAESARGPRRVETVSQDVGPFDSEFPAETTPSNPYQRFDWNLLRNPDGSLTKVYYFRAEPGVAVYVQLMKRFVPGFAELREGQDYWSREDYLSDPRRASEDVWHPGGATGLAFGSGEVGDLLLVTAAEDVLRQIDAFLEGTLSEVPQVELEVTIVEIRLDDDLRWGTQFSATRGTPEDAEGNLIDSVVVDLAQDLVNGTFGSFSAIQDETVVNGLVEFLETTTSSNILSSPKLAVVNGYRAVIDTGSETPFFTPRFSASGVSQITTQFKPTGIKVVVLPFIMSADVVQLDLNIEVSSVTGFVTAGIGSDAEVENPLIARRNAYTIVNVPSGKSVLIGGLVISNDVDSVDEVPWLGRIPLLGRLFQRRTTTKQSSQVLFLVKPRIVYDKFHSGVLYDPQREFEEWTSDQ